MANDQYKRPMTLSESEELLKGAADHDRVKSDWSFLGHSFVAFGAVIALAAIIISIILSFF